MKLTVVGCGYLGAVHAVSMAKLGHSVIGIDVDTDKIAKLAAGEPPFFEPGFQELLWEGLENERLKFSTDFSTAIGSEAHFLAVGTPQRQGETSADLTFLNQAFRSLSPHLSEGSVVIGKSTVPVGTAARLAQELEKNSQALALAWNPEFLREGFAIQDTLRPDRLVYGISGTPKGDQAKQVLDNIYADAIQAGTPVIVSNFETAELVKIAANSFLATKISFINAMAEISEVVGADVTQLADALGHDKRIGRQFLNAGVGFGGGCLPKDIRAFTARAAELGLSKSVEFLESVDQINLRRRQRVIDLAASIFEGKLFGREICILGATFKPGSDDVRDSPALDIAQRLWEQGAKVRVTDPKGIQNAKIANPNLTYHIEVEDALMGADMVILLTEWPEFVSMDPSLARGLVQQSEAVTIIDGRNCLDADRWKSAGWNYIGMGR